MNLCEYKDAGLKTPCLIKLPNNNNGDMDTHGLDHMHGQQQLQKVKIIITQYKFCSNKVTSRANKTKIPTYDNFQKCVTSSSASWHYFRQ